VGDKKEKKPYQESQKNPTEICQKGKMDRSKKMTEPLDLDEEQLHGGIREIDTEEADPITHPPPYIPPRKATAKAPKDLDSVKFMVSTPLLLENVLFEGNLLAHIPNMKMEDWDMGHHERFLQLAPSKYLKKVYYEESNITQLESMKWVAGVRGARLLNMLWVLYLSCTTINIVCLCQVLTLVHDGSL